MQQTPNLSITSDAMKHRIALFWEIGPPRNASTARSRANLQMRTIMLLPPGAVKGLMDTAQERIEDFKAKHTECLSRFEETKEEDRGLLLEEMKYLSEEHENSTCVANFALCRLNQFFEQRAKFLKHEELDSNYEFNNEDEGTIGEMLDEIDLHEADPVKYAWMLDFDFLDMEEGEYPEPPAAPLREDSFDMMTQPPTPTRYVYERPEEESKMGGFISPQPNFEIPWMNVSKREPVWMKLPDKLFQGKFVDPLPVQYVGGEAIGPEDLRYRRQEWDTITTMLKDVEPQTPLMRTTKECWNVSIDTPTDLPLPDLKKEEDLSWFDDEELEEELKNLLHDSLFDGVDPSDEDAMRAVLTDMENTWSQYLLELAHKNKAPLDCANQECGSCYSCIANHGGYPEVRAAFRHYLLRIKKELRQYPISRGSFNILLAHAKINKWKWCCQIKSWKKGDEPCGKCRDCIINCTYDLDVREAVDQRVHDFVLHNQWEEVKVMGSLTPDHLTVSGCYMVDEDSIQDLFVPSLNNYYHR